MRKEIRNIMYTKVPTSREIVIPWMKTESNELFTYADESLKLSSIVPKININKRNHMQHDTQGFSVV